MANPVTVRRIDDVLSEISPYLNSRQNELVDQLCDLVRIPGVAAEGREGIDATIEAILAKCDRDGLTARVEQTPGNPVVVVTAGPDDASVRLLTYGHYDVFPAAEQPGWTSAPFEPVVRGDRVFGRGTGDNKVQLMAHLNALAWWHNHGGGVPVHVTMIIEGEEEVGSPNLPWFAERHRDELAADLCVYSDGTMPGEDRPGILFGCRGALCLEFVARGPRTPLHSGNFGGTVTNPILRLSRLFSEMVAPNGDLLVPGANDGLPEVTEAERDALRAMPFDEAAFREQTGQAPLPARFGEDHYERLLYRPSLTVSGISGGQTDVFKTLIPDSATAKADLRLVGHQDPDAVLDAIRAFAAERGYDDIEVRKLFSQPPSRTPIDHPKADVVARAMESGFGRSVARVPSLAGTTPDWVFTKLLGLPTFMIPFGAVDQNHHGPDESARISLYLGGIRTVAVLLALLADQAEGTPA